MRIYLAAAEGGKKKKERNEPGTLASFDRAYLYDLAKEAGPLTEKKKKGKGKREKRGGSILSSLLRGGSVAPEEGTGRNSFCFEGPGFRNIAVSRGEEEEEEEGIRGETGSFIPTTFNNEGGGKKRGTQGKFRSAC